MSVTDRPVALPPVAVTAPRSRPTTPAPAPAAATPPGQFEETVSFLSSGLIMVSVLALWFIVQLLFLGGLSQARDQHLLYADLRSHLADATAPTGPVVPVGQPVALLSITRMSLQQVVVEGTASGDLAAGPGHRRDTVLPGQVGTSLVYGKARTDGGPFGALGTMRKGDQIVTQTVQGRVVYTVDGVRRAGDPLPKPVTGTQARLVLVSSEGGGLMGSVGSARTVYVDATAPKGFAAPAAPARALPSSERAMAGDPGALPLLALCLALLLGLTAAVTWARRRWSTALVWLVASPVALALAWGTTDVAVRLLPNLL